MINGIAFLTVITAAVTASLIDQLRRRRAPGEPDAEGADAAVMEKLDEISGRLDEIESAVGLRRQDRGPSAAGSMVSEGEHGRGRAAATGIILATLASGQFVMALDTTVMNTAIATVADDVDSTVTGIQTAITLYALVMASLMITGGKLGAILGRKRAFSIGCVIYACGSLTTSLAPNLTVLMIGWSFLEGLGAVLIMPAIVGLVASNFGRSERPRAYGLVAAAAAMAAALGPVIGGAFTTYASWRWVFAGEVVIILGILVLARRMNDTPAEEGVRLDLGGTVLSALGLGLIVLGILQVGHVGLRPAQARRPGAARALACDLDDPGRRCRAGPVPALGEPAHRAGSGRADRPGDAAQPPAAKRRHVVPVHVHGPGGACSSPFPCSCRSPSGCRRSKPECACCRSRSRCCSSPRGSRSCGRTSLRSGWSALDSSPCSPAWCCWSPCWTSGRARR